MKNNVNITSKRKDEHLDICLNEDVSFVKTNGFEKYDFVHEAPTEVVMDDINFSTHFLGKTVSFPFVISSMTGGSKKAALFNEKLAVIANELNIPMGVGSQRASLESLKNKDSFSIVRKIAQDIPIMSNIGAAQFVKLQDVALLNSIIQDISADGLIIHLNPLQELLQKEGEINFKGLLKRITEVKNKLNIRLIVKEVGSGISQNAARKLISSGIDVIDVSGAGGTSWAAVELLRNPDKENDYFREWGLRTSYCISQVSQLKKEYEFTLIGSGGINNFVDAAKSISLGADLIASAGVVLKTLDKFGVDGVVNLINDWFCGVKKIMFLTGSQSLKEFQNSKIKKMEEMY